MLGLHQRGVPCSIPIQLPSTPSSAAGTCCQAYYTYASFPSTSDPALSQQHIVRMLSYIPGRLLGDVPQTPGILHGLGVLLGRLSVALAQLFTPLPSAPSAAGGAGAEGASAEATAAAAAAAEGGAPAAAAAGAAVPQALLREHAWLSESAAMTLRRRLPQAQILSDEQRCVEGRGRHAPCVHPARVYGGVQACMPGTAACARKDTALKLVGAYGIGLAPIATDDAAYVWGVTVEAMHGLLCRHSLAQVAGLLEERAHALQGLPRQVQEQRAPQTGH